MDKYTVLRFGGGKGSAKLVVELGAIDLTGAGSYGLDIGDVKLAENGSIRITAKGQGRSSIELLVGAAQISGLDGQVIELALGQAIELGIGPIKVDSIVDAAVDAPPPVVDAGTEDAGVGTQRSE